MSLPVIIEDDAGKDIIEIGQWYEQEALLADQFFFQIDVTVQAIAAYPLSNPVLFRNARKARLNQFPYNMFYRILEDEIKVFAVIHCKRHHRTWKSRI